VAEQGKATQRIKRISEAKLRLNSFVSIPLALLAKDKRRTGRIDINDCVLRLLVLISPIAEYFKVRIESLLSNQYAYINGSEALIDGICLNLIMNSLNAFQREGYAQPDRRIRISTAYDGYSVVLSVEDNGGGIDGVDLKDIWLPGVTTASEGTGFGLTIVRDSVADLGGAVDAVALTPFGGAEIIVRLPPMRALL
jgi:C4-dicarboxylate-specific signal transduction histidine kinase